MKELYSQGITDPSLKELEELAKWYNEKLGNYPVIVGGWAAYVYSKGLGSKDIDIVFPSAASMHQTLSAYFLSHGYTERHRGHFGFDKEIVKTVKSGGLEVDIIIDAVSSDRTITFEGSKARLPWSWASRHSVEKKVGSATIRIPNVELLLTYKLGAVFGRNINIKTGLDFDYYRSKIWKDVHDIAGLSRLEIDGKKVAGFLKESGLDAHKEEIAGIIDDNYTEETRNLVKGADMEKIRKILTGSGGNPITTKTPGRYNPRFS